jgi:uncharacterized protein (DUF2235 family)
LPIGNANVRMYSRAADFFWFVAMVNISPADAAPTKKRVAVLLDGTWNTVNDNTNVWRLKSLLASQGRDELEQISYYSVGVGTAFGERLRGGMFGYGLNNEIIRAYEWLIDHYNIGDELFVFGFSRSAYTARSLSCHSRKSHLSGFAR